MSFDVEQSTTTEFLRAVVELSREKQVTLVGASLAYYSFNSLVPLVLVMLLAVTLLGEFPIAAALLSSVLEASPSWAEPLLDAAGQSSDRTRVAGIALAVFFWSTFRLFAAVGGVFAAVYETRARETIFGTLRDTMVVALTILVGLTGLGAIGLVVVSLFGARVLAAVPAAILFFTLLVVFIPIYYVFPSVPMAVLEAVPGAAFAAGSWTVASVGFRYYVVTTSSVELYGVAGAVLLVLAWLYVGGVVLLVGAVMNVLLAGRVNPVEE